MGRLYPPMIEGTIPAFSGTTLVVPFSLNKAVSTADIKGITIKIKTVNGVLKDTLNHTDIILSGDCYATFIINPDKYTIGQYYKIQIAFYGEKHEVGYYSTVGVVKYTTPPIVTIKDLKFGDINPHCYYYTGIYSQKKTSLGNDVYAGGDPTEKIYSYRFTITDDFGNIINDTGEILHNSTKDVESDEAHEEYCFAQDIKTNESYYIQFTVTTINQMKASSPRYRLTQKRSISPELDLELVATLDEGSGFINLTIGKCSSELITGTFLLSRNSNADDESWIEMKRFSLHAVKAASFSIKDCTVEHGVKYKYSIQQYNSKNIYSERIISNTVMVDFEDSFLFDGERQLRIRFNPQVSSFKTNYADQKTDTIGSQHPFIIRNGNMAYKEFPIGGLISYHMDEDNHMFLPKKELHIEESSNDLTSENIIAERIFKMEVLDWLNDGKPKLFRSPVEGNYIVRLMNVSLSPNQQLGRMLHNFSATAYEIAEFNAANLEKFKIIDAAESLEEQMQWSSVYLPDLYDTYHVLDANGKEISSSVQPVQLNTEQRRAFSVRFTDMIPGSFIYLDDEQIMIGATGAFLAESEKGFGYVGTDSRFLTQGMCTYGYKAKTITMFNLVDDLTLKDVPVRQFIGTRDLGGVINIYDALSDLRTEITAISMLRFEKRPVEFLYIDYDGEMPIEKYLADTRNLLYFDMDCKQPVTDLSALNELATYQLRGKRSDYTHSNLVGEQYYVDRMGNLFSPYFDYYLDGYYLVNDGIRRCYPITDDMYDIHIGDEIINIAEEEKYQLAEPELFKPVMPGNGLITEVGYSSQIITYSFESTNYDVQNRSQLYQQSVDKYWRVVTAQDADPISIKTAKQNMRNTYRNYLNSLSNAMDEYKEAHGKV